MSHDKIEEREENSPRRKKIMSHLQLNFYNKYPQSTAFSFITIANVVYSIAAT